MDDKLYFVKFSRYFWCKMTLFDDGWFKKKREKGSADGERYWEMEKEKKESSLTQDQINIQAGFESFCLCIKRFHATFLYLAFREGGSCSGVEFRRTDMQLKWGIIDYEHRQSFNQNTSGINTISADIHFLFKIKFHRSTLMRIDHHATQKNKTNRNRQPCNDV